MERGRAVSDARARAPLGPSLPPLPLPLAAPLRHPPNDLHVVGQRATHALCDAAHHLRPNTCQQQVVKADSVR